MKGDVTKPHGSGGKTVNLDKLARRLKRDLAANPKRAALLGLVLLVAGYFWAPLISKWLNKGAKKPTGSPPAVVAKEATPSQEPDKTKLQPKWDKILAWMEADPRMASRRLPADVHPFGRSVPQKPAPERTVEERDAPQAPAVIDVTPKSLGAVLNGVLIGTKTKQATINGETYRLGELIEFTSKEGNGKLQFELAHVKKDGVLLRRGSKLHELTLENTKLVGRDSIVVRDQRPEARDEATRAIDE